MKQVLWVCAAGTHPAVRGPSRPRKDNLCRYCVPCSQVEGKLVARVSPAIEKKRAARAEASRGRANAKRAKKRDAREQTDVMREFRSANMRIERGVKWPGSLRFVEVLASARPRAPRFQPRGVTIYDPGFDKIEARAAMYVVLARWYVERVRQIKPADKAFYTTALRQFIEYVTNDAPKGPVRPRLESIRPADVEAEVADLLRRREAVAVASQGG